MPAARGGDEKLRDLIRTLIDKVKDDVGETKAQMKALRDALDLVRAEQIRSSEREIASREALMKLLRVVSEGNGSEPIAMLVRRLDADVSDLKKWRSRSHQKDGLSGQAKWALWTAIITGAFGTFGVVIRAIVDFLKPP